jgi:hypothetical protein
MYGRADGMPSFQLTMAVRGWYLVLSFDSLFKLISVAKLEGSLE